MKCPECGRRNNDENNFCVGCVSQLKKISKEARVVLPPQDMADRIKGKSPRLPMVRKSLSPAVIPMAVLVIGFVTIYYFIYYVDTYKVQAVEYYSFDGSTESTR